MKKTSLITSFILAAFLNLSVIAQTPGPANIWYFGTKGGLDFSGGTPTKLTNSAMNLGNYNGEGMATICDSLGNLLFYTDGVTVYTAAHAVMTGGTGIQGNTSATQTALIVPVPGSKILYYIFSTPGEEASAASGTGTADALNGLRYSIVNTSTNTVTNKNILLTPAGIPITEAQTAAPHFDGTSFWLICKQAGNKSTGAGSNNFYAYRIGTNNITTTTGVINALNGTADEVVSSSGRLIPGVTAPPATIASSGGIMTMKINSCFNKLAVAYFALAKEVQLFDFSNTTGLISLANTITNFAAADPNEVYGVEFSPNNKYLYASVMFFNSGAEAVRGKIYQFDISSGVNATIDASSFTHSISAPASSNGIGALQLAQDKKIYYALYHNNPIGGGSSSSYVGRIGAPDAAGASANFTDDYITFALANPSDLGVAVKMGLPQVYKGFIAGLVTVASSSVTNLDEVCVGDLTQFNATYTQTASNYNWDMNTDGTSEFNSATSNPVNYVYTSPGTFDITLKVTDATCAYIVTEKSKVKVNPVSIVGATYTCSPLTFNVTSPDATKTYGWFKDAAGTQAWATGPSFVMPQSSDAGNVYVKEIGSATSSATSNYIVGTSYTFANNVTTNTSTRLSDTLTVADNVTFKTANFQLQSGYYDGLPNKTYTITLKRLSDNVVLKNISQNFTVDQSNNPNIVTVTFNQALTVGKYVIEVYNTANPAGYAPIKTASSMSPSSFPSYVGVSYVANNSPFFNLSFDYTSYTVAKKVCSKMTAVPYNCPLPVTWLSFTANRTPSQSVLLDWATASEQNNKTFYVQRSLDGINFETIAEVPAAGNSNSVKYYQYNDVSAPIENVYYRFLQEDFDGKSQYSKIVYVTKVGKFDLSIVPNPGSGSFAITGLSGDVKLIVAVYTITGQSIFTTTAYSGEVINLEGVAKGFYIVKIVSGSTEQSIRYINQ